MIFTNRKDNHLNETIVTTNNFFFFFVLNTFLKR